MDILGFVTPLMVLFLLVEFFGLIALFVIAGIAAIMFIGWFIKTEFFPSENKELGPLV